MTNSFRCFMITLWLETDSYDPMEVLNHIIELNYDFAYIIHDKDDSKPHIHIVIYLGRDVKKTLNTIYKEIGYVKKEDIEIEPNLKNALLYLIHFNNQNKHKYSIEEVYGTLLEKLKSYISISDEGSKIIIIKNFIKKNKPTLDSLTDFVYSQGYWSEFRRNYSIIKDMLIQFK